MALVMNLLGLILVLGLCWMAMMWLSRGFHGVPRAERGLFEEHRDHEPTDLTGALPSRTQDLPQAASADRGGNYAPCDRCEGVGAQTMSGRLRPCPECLGTGVLS